MSDIGDTRSLELVAGLARTRQAIAEAASAANRDPADIELLVVTKFHPSDDVVRLIDLGELAFGESREPEASRKMTSVRAERPGVAFVADMIGRVQRKKAGSVARWARRVHSIDSLALIEAFDGAATRALDAGERDTPLGLLLQVSLDGDPDRGGLQASNLAAAADLVLSSPSSLTLDGLMLIAPLEMKPDAAMAQMAGVREGFCAQYPNARELSAGMSGDLKSAIAHGSTCVRVGTAIMGPRPILSL